MRILVINGPNLNMLGVREPDKYGSLTLHEVEELIRDFFKDKNVKIEFFQSNYEGKIIEKIQEARGRLDGIVINAGAFTHTSIAIRDAFLAVGIPFVEVHISNIFAREDFRKNSYLSDIAVGVVSGLGWKGYIYAIDFLMGDLDAEEREDREVNRFA